MSTNVPSTPKEAWRTAAMVLVSLPTGVTLFAVIAIWLRSGQDGADVGLLMMAWMGLALLEVVAGLILWKRAVGPHLPASGFASNPEMATLAKLQNGLIVCMALAEGIALFGVVIYFLGGPLWVALASVAISWATLLIVWPRRAWYGLR